MTAVLQSPSHLPSSPSSSLSCTPNDGSRQTRTHLNPDPLTVLGGEEEDSSVERKGRSGGEREGEEEERRKRQEEDQLSLLALLLAVFRKSLVGCRTEREEDLRSMEIGPPMNVRHIAHVTFDRFHGFLGLPVEFEPEVPRRAPSASTSVFGVSTESMQCSYDFRGNSVPTILLLMQRRLYEQGGLQAEGVFRIAANNSQEEHVRDQLNSGIVPDGIDVHCLAGLIKAWFRELPTGVLDSLSPEEVMQCQSEEQCAQLVKLLPPTEAGLLDWAINLMADVVQEEHQNKMNAHNIAVVFAPNMTKMEDPMTALMHAVQVMNLLRTLIIKTLRDRQESAIEAAVASQSEPSDENDHHSPSRLYLDVHREEETERVFVPEEPTLENPSDLPVYSSTADDDMDSSLTSREKVTSEGERPSTDENPYEVPMLVDNSTNGPVTTVNVPKTGIQVNSRRSKVGQSSNLNLRKGQKRASGQSTVRITVPAEKSRGISIVSRINSRVERVEAWR